MGSVTVNGNNQISSSGFAYDASGNTLYDGTIPYTYDAESQIKTAAGVTYLYDGSGRRVSKSSGKLYWYGSGGEILAETDTSGNTLNEYIFFGGRRVAMLPAGGNAQFYAEDFLGSARVITTNNGTVCYDADFDPYGGEHPYTDTCPQNYKFEGKERDTETGNDDFGARYYSSRFGRWLSSDWSSTPVPVPYANLTNPQTLNLYAMVSDDPESFADLDGHCDPGPGCSLQLLQAIQNFADHPGEYVKAFVWGAIKQQLADTREALGPRIAPPDSTLNPSNDVERLGAGLLGSTKDTAAVVLPILDGVGGLAKEPGGSFMGPKDGSTGGPGAGKRFSPTTQQAIVDENAAANGGTVRCVYCGDKVTNEPGPNKVNIDHVDAKANGGNNTQANGQVTCQYCNQSKGTGPVPKNPKPPSDPTPDQKPQ